MALIVKSILALGFAANCLAALVAADAPATRPAVLELKDDHGVTVRPLALGSAKAAVFIFAGTECPISNSYAPEINRICEQYLAKGIRFYIVHSEANLTDAEAVKHARDFGFSCPVVMDRGHALAKFLGATATPQAAVADPAGRVVYLGRIDDLFVALGQQRHQATTHELRDALDAVMAGKDVPTPRTRVVGCAIGD